MRTKQAGKCEYGSRVLRGVVFVALLGILVFPDDARSQEGYGNRLYDIYGRSRESWGALGASYDARSLSEILELDDDEIDVATVALFIERGLRPRVSVEKYRKQIDGIAAKIIERMPENPTPEEAISVINAYLYDRMRLKGYGTTKDPGNSFPSKVLSKKRGDCLGLSTLYLAIGRRVGLPLEMVWLPDHVFVRYSHDGVIINIETLEGGRRTQDSYYEEEIEIDPDGIYPRKLDVRGVIAVQLSKRGATHYRKGRFAEAIADLTLAVKLDPRLVEAYINRGSVWVKRKNFERAMADFTRAIEIYPNCAKAYNNRAVVYYVLEDYDEAWRDVTAAQSLRYYVPESFVADLWRASPQLID